MQLESERRTDGTEQRAWEAWKIEATAAALKGRHVAQLRSWTTADRHGRRDLRTAAKQRNRALKDGRATQKRD